VLFLPMEEAVREVNEEMGQGKLQARIAYEQDMERLEREYLLDLTLIEMRNQTALAAYGISPQFLGIETLVTTGHIDATESQPCGELEA
jgi:hypothetical protein